ncbi:hypothetical protein CU098_012249, partial [Rhizopus stolonifer]
MLRIQTRTFFILARSSHTIQLKQVLKRPLQYKWTPLQQTTLKNLNFSTALQRSFLSNKKEFLPRKEQKEKQ